MERNGYVVLFAAVKPVIKSESNSVSGIAYGGQAYPQIILLKMQGYSTKEIALLVGLTKHGLLDGG